VDIWTALTPHDSLEFSQGVTLNVTDRSLSTGRAGQAIVLYDIRTGFVVELPIQADRTSPLPRRGTYKEYISALAPVAPVTSAERFLDSALRFGLMRAAPRTPFSFNSCDWNGTRLRREEGVVDLAALGDESLIISSVTGALLPLDVAARILWSRVEASEGLALWEYGALRREYSDPKAVDQFILALVSAGAAYFDGTAR
jgi:hypothetical protein